MTLDVRPVRAEELDDLLPLIAGYQRFYETEPDPDRNRDFFGRFLAPSEEGLLLGAWKEGRAVGFATLYWTYSSTRAADIALMNDLFVSEEARGEGAGKQLIAAAAAAARERGLEILEWYTAPDNAQAQRLYDGVEGAERSEWIAYDVELGEGPEPRL